MNDNSSEANNIPASNQLFDLIQSIQTKLNNENKTNDSNTNLNLTENQNTESNCNENIELNQNNDCQKVDFSSILKNIDINNLINNLSQNSANNVQQQENQNSFNIGGIDPSMLLKFGNMFSSATRNDPKRNLLLSLKPFLRKTRQDKLNEYVTILTIVDAIGIFNSKGSGK